MNLSPEIIQRIKEAVDPELLLSRLGFHISRRASKELRGPCRAHGGDNPTAFRLRLDTKTWLCFTHHCEQEFSNDLIGLVRKVLGCSFIESVQFLAEIAGISLESGEVDLAAVHHLRVENEVQKEIRQAKSDKIPESSLSEEFVQSLLPYRSDYFVERGFPKDLLDFFGVGGMVDPYGIHRDMIPIRDADGQILTMSGRRVDSDAPPKYWMLQRIPKGATLYNLHIAKEYVGGPPQGPRTLIVVEGFVDVWQLALLNVWNVVALMGTGITPKQCRLLSAYADVVVLLLDGDEAGQKATGLVEKALSRYVDVIPIRLPDGKDPKMFTLEDVHHYLGSYAKPVQVNQRC